MANPPTVTPLDYLKQWWNAQPTPAPEAMRVNPRTGNKEKPTPLSTFGGGAQQIFDAWRRGHFGADMLRDTAKGLVQAAGHPADTVSSVSNAMSLVGAGRYHEQTGKWPGGKDRAMAGVWSDPKQQQAAINAYRSFASNYSYVDPKTGQRNFDWGSFTESLRNHPTEVASLFLPGAEEAAAASKMPMVAKAMRVASAAANPAGYGVGALASKAVPPVTRLVRRVAPYSVVDSSGAMRPEIASALKAQGFEPASYNSPEAIKAFQDVMGRKGLSPATVKEAVGRVSGVKVPRSSSLGEAAPRDISVEPEVSAHHAENDAALRGGMRSALGASDQPADLGSAFSNAYIKAKSKIQSLYDKVREHTGVYANAGDFATGLRDSIRSSLSNSGFNWSDVLNDRSPLFEKTRQMLTKLDPEYEFKGLAGDPEGRATSIETDKGDFTRNNDGTWQFGGLKISDPETVRGLERDAARLGLDTPSAENRLTPQNIELYRRKVNSFLRNASGDDARAARAVLDGLDNYLEKNHSNYVPAPGEDPSSLIEDLQNARRANKAFFTTFDENPTNKIIRDASAKVRSGLTADSSGALTFSGDSEALDSGLKKAMFKGDTLEHPITGSGSSTTSGQKVVADLSGILGPEGQDVLAQHVRNQIANSPEHPSAVKDYAISSPFLSGDEAQNVARIQDARMAAAPGTAPTTIAGHPTIDFLKNIAGSGGGAYLGSKVDAMLGTPGIAATAGAGIGASAASKLNVMSKAHRVEQELAGAPASYPTVAPTSLVAPISLGEMMTPGAPTPPPPAPAAQPAQAKPDNESLEDVLERAYGGKKHEESLEDVLERTYGNKSAAKEAEELPDITADSAPQESTGGRIAYKKGGAVKGENIEPLVQALMSKAKKAKKISNKATEPLLNAHDNAIATALAAAQKAI